MGIESDEAPSEDAGDDATAEPSVIEEEQPGDEKNPDVLRIERADNESDGRAFARVALSSHTRNAMLARTYGDDFFKITGDGKSSDLETACEIVGARCMEIREGNLTSLTDILTSQMATLDALFTSMVMRAGNNMGQYPEAVDRYMGIAMKAQAGCRTTAETLARIKRGGKQTVKVVHVYPGGQAVVADTVNNGTRSGRFEDDEAERAADAAIPAMLGHEPEGDSLPIASFARPDKVQAPRRTLDGGTEGQ